MYPASLHGEVHEHPFSMAPRVLIVHRPSDDYTSANSMRHRLTPFAEDDCVVVTLAARPVKGYQPSV